MSKIRNNRKGFTLAEVLIVAAIIVVLAGVSVVAVFRYQRSLKQLELDGIAKEIFVAAQNHLTMAESQGYLGLSKENTKNEYGVPSDLTADNGKQIYYFVVGADSASTGSYTSPDAASGTVLSLMLPFASVDETVRMGGSYVIRYQRDPGIVLDVFYAEKNGRYPYTLGNASRSGETSEYALLMNSYKGSTNKSSRRDAGDFEHAVLGWYGGDEVAALPTGTPLDRPTITVYNEETLWVKVVNPNSGVANVGLKLVVTGLNSKESWSVELDTSSLPSYAFVDSEDGSLHVTLDDITYRSSDAAKNNHHFAKIFEGSGLIPGEDIEIYALAYNNKQITDSSNGKSNTEVTNSLFDYDGDGNDLTANVKHVRHLENLDGAISGFPRSPSEEVRAKQINNLSWPSFLSANGKTDAISVQVTERSGNPATGTGANYFSPVNSNYQLKYDGQSNTIERVQIDYSGNAGLFGALNTGDSVSNLKLLDFAVTSSTNETVTSGKAGALAGLLAGTASVSNVVAYNENDSKTAATIQGAGNVSVGGLVGEVSGGTVTNSAAALVVSSTGGSAGGLIGSVTGNGVTVTASYSGGHTDGTGNYSDTSFNVTAPSGNAGGLIGDAGSAAITNCYSTCSATGATVGGLVGSASGTITNCYATGLVSGTTEGAFAGSLSSAPTNCKYYMIINERSKGAGAGYEYLASVGDTTSSTAGITALDDDPSSFNRFVQVKTSGSSPADAKPYDNTLKTTYGGKYDLQSVSRLGGTVTPSDFVSIHYGDWPSPEIWVINTSTGGTGGGGGSTDPNTTDVESYPLYAYFDVTFEGNDGNTYSVNSLRYQINMVSEPAERVKWKEYGGGLYFTDTGPATLTFTAPYSSAPIDPDKPIVVEVNGIASDESKFSYELLGPITQDSSSVQYTVSFTNESAYDMHHITVTIWKYGDITGDVTLNMEINPENPIARITEQTSEKITLEYYNNNQIVYRNSSDNSSVLLKVTGTGDYGLSKTKEQG